MATKTQVVAFRLPKEVFAIVQRRAVKRRMTIAQYLRRFVEYDATRRR